MSEQEMIVHAIAKTATRLFVDFPFFIALIRFGIWAGLAERCELPVPTMRQTIGIAAILAFVS